MDRSAGKGDATGLRAVPAIEALGVLKIVVEAVCDVEIVRKNEYPFAIKPTTRVRACRVEYSSKEHGSLNACRKKARAGDRIAPKHQDMLNTLWFRVEFALSRNDLFDHAWLEPRQLPKELRGSAECRRETGEVDFRADCVLPPSEE